MTPQLARSDKGERAYSERPTSQGTHYTTIGIIGHDGMKFDHTFQGFLTKAYFITLLKVYIIPMFANTNDYLIMDNCSSHNNEDVRKLLKENNVNYLFLSPYSPEYNPIDTLGLKLKIMLKNLKLDTSFF